MKLVVTGGSGHIGSVVVKHLAACGHEVTNIDHQFTDGLPARFVYMDLRHRELLQPILQQADAVVHLGELPSPYGHSDDSVYSHNTCIAATVLTTAAELKLQRVIYTSSVQAYGFQALRNCPSSVPDYLPVDEVHPVHPNNSYALAKCAGESYCRFMNEKYGQRISIFRLPMVLYQNINTPDHLQQHRRNAQRQTLEFLGAYLHPEDVARAYQAALDRDLDGCRTYNLCADDSYLVRNVHALRDEYHPQWPQPASDWPDDKPLLLNEQAKAELGWTPQWSMRRRYQELTGESW